MANEFAAGPVFWRAFNPGDTVFAFGVAEGILRPGEPLDFNHAGGSFKLELRRVGLGGAFIVGAGPIFSNTDELVLTVVGQLLRKTKKRRRLPKILPGTNRPVLPHQGPAIVLRVMAWNCQEGLLTARPNPPPLIYDREGEALPRLAEVIRSQTPDIVLLNEILFRRFGAAAGNQAEKLAQMTGHRYVQYAECNFLGVSGIKLVAVLSRFPLGQKSDIRTVYNGADIGYATLKTSIAVAGRTYHIYSTRFDHSDPGRNMRSAELAATSIGALPLGAPVIFGGDFNSVGDPTMVVPTELEDALRNASTFRYFADNSGLVHLTSPLVDHLFFRGPGQPTGQVVSPPNNPSDHPFVSADLDWEFFGTYGSTVKIRHVATGRLLHSHPLNYGHPNSSRQQQVTGYAAADDNDWWLIKGPHGSPDGFRAGQAVRSGDIIRLEHVATRRNLHSHGGIPSPVTRQQEVTCFGQNGVGDGNDHWEIQFGGGGEWRSNRPVRLIHTATNHALHSHLGFSHPQWTAGQQEVTGFATRDENDLWSLFEIR